MTIALANARVEYCNFQILLIFFFIIFQNVKVYYEFKA